MSPAITRRPPLLHPEQMPPRMATQVRQVLPHQAAMTAQKAVTDLRGMMVIGTAGHPAGMAPGGKADGHGQPMATTPLGAVPPGSQSMRPSQSQTSFLTSCKAGIYSTTLD